MYICVHRKYPLLSDFNKILIFWAHFRKILKYEISWKFAQWWSRKGRGAEGRKGMTKLISRFSKFCESSEEKIYSSHSVRINTIPVLNEDAWKTRIVVRLSVLRISS